MHKYSLLSEGFVIHQGLTLMHAAWAGVPPRRCKRTVQQALQYVSELKKIDVSHLLCSFLVLHREDYVDVMTSLMTEQ